MRWLIILDIFIFAFAFTATAFYLNQDYIDEVAIKREADATSEKNLEKLNNIIEEDTKGSDTSGIRAVDSITR